MSTILATVTYVPGILEGRITSSPWQSVSALFPQRGSVPSSPQFSLEVLQPDNLDGARYRVGGAHFPQFTMTTIVPTSTFISANTIAREMELLKGEFIDLNIVATGATHRCAVIDVVATPTAKRVIGAVAQGGGGLPGQGANNVAALACVDTLWTLQVVAQ